MQSDYPECIRRLLTHEGGYTNDAADPGGPTNWGITIYDARMYWLPGATAADVRAMPKSVALDIYDKKYWHAMLCDQLPAGVDDVVFDYGVNSGNSRSVRVLQRLMGMEATGKMTMPVLQKVAATDPNWLIDQMCDERMRFLHGLRTFSTFGHGWTTRVAEVRKFAHELAAGRSPTHPTPTPEVQGAGKGKVPPPSTGGKVGTGGAVAVGVGATLAHWLGVGAAVVGMVAAVVLTLALIHWWHDRQQHREA